MTWTEQILAHFRDEKLAMQKPVVSEIITEQDICKGYNPKDNAE